MYFRLKTINLSLKNYQNHAGIGVLGNVDDMLIRNHCFSDLSACSLLRFYQDFLLRMLTKVIALRPNLSIVIALVDVSENR